jgi:hypothetical protein
LAYNLFDIRNVPGDSRVCFLKKRLKWVGSLKPNLYAISFEEYEVLIKRDLATERVRFEIQSLTVLPVLLFITEFK